MVIKEIMITRGRKWAWDFGNSVGYNVGLTFDIDEDNKDFDLVRQEIIKALQKLVIAEEIRCRDTMLLQDYENSKKPEAPKQEATSSGHPVEKLVVTEEKAVEKVVMDLSEVTVMVCTEKALLVTKKGFQKWVAFALMDGITNNDYNEGEYIEKIIIKADKRKWFNEVKGWDKLEVRKR